MFFKVWFWLQSKHEQRSLLLFRTPQWIMKVQTKLIVSYHFWAGSDFSTLLEQNQFCLLNGNVINILPIHWLHCKIPSRYFYLEFKQLISSKSDISKKPVICRIEDQTVLIGPRYHLETCPNQAIVYAIPVDRQTMYDRLINGENDGNSLQTGFHQPTHAAVHILLGLMALIVVSSLIAI